EDVVLDFELGRRNLKGTVVDISENRKPVADIEVGAPKFGGTFDFGRGYSSEPSPLTKTDKNGKFQFEDLSRSDMMFLAKGTSKDLYGFAYVDESKDNLEIEVAPLQNVSGRLIRSDDSKPLAEYEIMIKAVLINETTEQWPPRYYELGFPTISVKTGSEGRFQCSGLMYGIDYSLRLQPKDPDGWDISFSFTEKGEITLFRIDKPEEKQLGDISVPQSKYEPSGWQMHNATMVGSFVEDFTKKYTQAQRYAKKNGQNIVVLLTEINFSTHQKFLELFYDDPEVRAVSKGYQLLVRENRRFSDYDNEQFKPVAEKLGLNPDDINEPTVCILNAEGTLLEAVPWASLRKKSNEERLSFETDSVKLIELLKKHSAK
ncbi:MAG: hypothetical protein ACRC2T_04615, partial [Thermoguttaceae bacterium]